MMRILIILYIIQVGDSQFSLNTYVSITVGVLKHYHSTCVYLLYSTHQQGEYYTNTVGRTAVADSQEGLSSVESVLETRAIKVQ
jgi:hypothetical protein